ncbi:unnamed protein product [Durusdinium trenchii]|uniref:Uncharacterized protein n=2 Tax=Durusdinium trenchii TaxID=1381693 RepID=A0ABP0NUI9_9DINO
MPLVAPTQRKAYTVEEVAKHNTAASLWVIMNRKVYDVTAFHKKHPGGAGVLLQMGGKDATAAAAAAHKSILPANLMWEFCIGHIVRVKPPDEVKKEEPVAKAAAKKKKSAPGGEPGRRDQARRSPPSFVEDVERMLSRPTISTSKSAQEVVGRSSIVSNPENPGSEAGQEGKLERTFTTIMEEMDSEIMALDDDIHKERPSAPSAGIGLLCFLQGNACWSSSGGSHGGLQPIAKVA